tara:strand:+ start:154423 stop:158769 length:4347 start_codon:yes stop_codon:yes gene_type:complete
MNAVRVLIISWLAISTTGCLEMDSTSDVIKDVLNPITEIEFAVADTNSGSIEYTNSQAVVVSISEDDGVVAWCITEFATTSADSSCSGGQGPNDGWFASRPDNFTLSEGEGLKRVYLKTKDEEGNLMTRSFDATIYFDSTPPLVTMSSPPDITTINVGSYTLVGTCSESRPVNLEIGGVAYQSACVSGIWTFSGDISGISDGPVSISMWQEDSAGNESSPISTSVTKDATPVVIIPSLPTEGYYINIDNQASITVSGNCTEDGDVVVSGAITDTIPCSSGIYARSYNPSSLSQGALQIDLDMVDGSGNPADTQTINFYKDTIAPTFTVTSASNGSYVNQASAVGFTFAGACSEEGSNIIVSGDVSASIACDGVSYSQDMDLSGLADGGLNFSLNFSDAAGNSATQIDLNLVKDVIPPVLTQTTFTSGSFIAADQVTFGGTCDDASSLVVSGADNATLSCSGSVWSHTTDAQNVDNTYGYTFTQVDGAGNSASVVVAWSRDYTPPTVDVVSIESGASEVNRLEVNVSVTASDISDVTHIRISNSNLLDNDCQSEYANNFWQAFGSGTEVFTHVVTPGEGPKKVCVWAKDVSGNVSTIVPSSGLIGTNADDITYIKDVPPTITLLDVTNNQPGPNYGTTFFAMGDPIRVAFAATDPEGFPEGAVTLYISEDNSTWSVIATDLGSPSPVTSVSGVYSGILAPSSGYFRIKAVATDLAGNQSIDALSAALNAGNWSVYAGVSNDGVGGASDAIQIKKSTFGIGYAQMAVDPRNQDVYVVSNGSGGGIVRAVAATGNSEYIIKSSGVNYLHTETNLSAEPKVSIGSTLIRFDSDGRLYVNDRGYISRIDLDTGDIKFLFGGGTDYTGPTYVGADVKIMQMASFDVDANKNIYAVVNCHIASGTWGDDFNNTIKIVKGTYDPGSDSYTVTDFAGDCNLGIPVSGVGLNQPMGTYRYRHLLALTVNNDGSLLYFGRSGHNYKIMNNNIYHTNINKNGYYLDKTQDVLLASSGDLYKYTSLKVAADDTEVGSTIIAKGSGACNNNGTEVSSACVNIYHGNSYGDVHAAWNGQIYFLDVGPRVRIINSSDNKIYTVAGTKHFYGDGIHKQFIRPSRVGGIVYKNASSPNQSQFPEGLYFTDRFAMTINYIDPSTGITSVIAGDQSLIGQGTTFDKNNSLGTQGEDRNLSGLAFDTDGYPWFVSKDTLRRVKSDGTYDNKIVGNGGVRWSNRAQGDSASGVSGFRGMGTGNITLYRNEGLFLVGNAYESAIRTNGGVVQYHDYNSDIVQHLMGGQDLPGGEGYSGDNLTSGDLVNDTIDSICNNQLGECKTVYNESQDRLYFSEGTRIRYIETPRSPTTATLHTLVTLPRQAGGFIFHPDGDRIYYLSRSSTKLYCVYIGSGTPQTHCDGNSLGPESDDGFSSIIQKYIGNSLTWKSTTELLLSTGSSEILQFRVPAD